ncbi:MAG: hypothetical protein AMXMBFR13_42600 [Phycisphaerae bacterium]
MAIRRRHTWLTTRRRSSALLGLRITFSGLLCMVILLLVGMAALNSEANLLFLLFGIGAGVVLVNAVAPVVMVRGLLVERVIPSAVVAGRTFSLCYHVRSVRRWIKLWSVVLTEAPTSGVPAQFPLGLVDGLGPGREERVDLTGRCLWRGRVELRGVRVLSRFPFGLFSCSVDVALPAELIVYPALGRFRRDPWRDRRLSDSPSSRNARQRGDHQEFYGVREYRPGDNLRWIHWRRSARTGQLVIRESTPVRLRQLVVLVDPWSADEPQSREVSGRWEFRRAPRGSARGWPDPRVERVISLAATAVCEALERGHRVGLIARADMPVVIAPSGGRMHRQRLLQELSLLKPGACEALDAIVSRVRWSSGWHGRCMLFAGTLGSTHERVIRFLTGRAEAALAIAGDSEGLDTLFEQASAEKGEHRMRKLPEVPC